jgi:predicted porin
MSTPKYPTAPALRLVVLAASSTIACLVMATSAHAQSTPAVQIYGLMDIGLGSFKDAGSDRVTRVESGAMTTSFFGFKGTEDLGNGLSANFVLESFMLNDTGMSGSFSGDPFYSRAAYVGLKQEGVGQLRMGRVPTPLFANVLMYNPLVSSYNYSPAIRSYYSYTGKTSGGTAWSNAVAYTSPDLAGVTVDLLYAPKESAQGDNTSAAVRYNGGALSAGLVVQRVQASFASGAESTWQLGASYNAGFAKFFGQYGRVRETDTATINAGTREAISQLGVSVPVGSGAVLASYGQARTTGAREATRAFTTVGYDHYLSKRTDLYAMAMADRWTDRANGSSFGVGIRHRF